MQESGLRAIGRLGGVEAGGPVPRYRACSRKAASAQSTAQREGAIFSEPEPPQRQGRMIFSRKLLETIEGQTRKPRSPDPESFSQLSPDTTEEQEGGSKCAGPCVLREPGPSGVPVTKKPAALTSSVSSGK